MSVTVAAYLPLFAGAVAAVLKYARPVCMRIYGACLAMGLPGNVQIAGAKMGLAINSALWMFGCLKRLVGWD